MRRLLLGAIIVTAVMTVVSPRAGADERTLVKAVEKLIIDHKQVSQENRALKERILALEAKVLTLEGQIKETRSSVSTSSSGNEKSLLTKIKVFFAGSDSEAKTKKPGEGQAAPGRPEPEKSSAVVQPRPGVLLVESTRDRRPDDGAEAKPNVTVVDPMRLLLKKEQPKDCSSAGDEGQDGSPVKREVAPLDSGCSG